MNIHKGYARHERVAAQLRRELAVLIQRELQNPEVGFVSVSDVEVSRDLGIARVYVTVYDAGRAGASIEALNRSAGFLRTRLGRLLRMRSMPALHFHHDTSVEDGQRMDWLLDSLRGDSAPDTGEKK